MRIVNYTSGIDTLSFIIFLSIFHWLPTARPLSAIFIISKTCGKELLAELTRLWFGLGLSVCNNFIQVQQKLHPLPGAELSIFRMIDFPI